MSEDNRQEVTPEEERRQQALDYHAYPTPGKIAVELTKPAETANDLALAYSLVLQSLYVKSRRTLITCTSTRRKATWLRLFLTARRFLVLVTLGH